MSWSVDGAPSRQKRVRAARAINLRIQTGTNLARIADSPAIPGLFQADDQRLPAFDLPPVRAMTAETAAERGGARLSH
jgi:hypothetical protein